jgi:hypothetical protein
LVGFDSQNRDLKKLYENENRVSFGAHNLQIDSRDEKSKDEKMQELKVDDSHRKHTRQPSMFSKRTTPNQSFRKQSPERDAYSNLDSHEELNSCLKVKSSQKTFLSKDISEFDKPLQGFLGSQDLDQAL